LVSDFKQYASAIDIIAEKDFGYIIFDIKKGSMNRRYATYQLNIYRYFIEHFVRRSVCNMVCISLRDREYYDIFRVDDAKVEELLYK
jgi:hypothetical protein